MTRSAPPDREAALRRALVAAGQRLAALGFAAGSDGNLSVRLAPDRVLITPSGLAKGVLQAEQMLVVDLAGEAQPDDHPARRGLRPSSEMGMHLEAYRRRPDVHAVIHAHPPLAIACTVAGISLAAPVLPEIVFHLGAIPTAPYATPGTLDGAAAIHDLVREHDALLLDRHGSLTLGETLDQALLRLEWVEQAAKVLLAAHAATGGVVTELPAEHLSRLRVLRQRAQE